ncbi:hypothetical protein FRB95_005548 [Tulasnella sp. JGI-2019a]|nr:hypothetical protein FRB95_005548 [Tulasnella sp. JGI-2019a]
MERVSWKKLVSRVGWLEESWFQCLISRSKPADVQSADIVRVKLLDVEVRGSGRLYLTGPPGEFWMWNVEEFKEEEVDKIRMVIGEIVGF